MTIFTSTAKGISLAAFEAMRRAKPETRHTKPEQMRLRAGGTSLIPLGNALSLMLR